MQQGLCNGPVSVRLSVCPVDPQQWRAAAGLRGPTVADVHEQRRRSSKCGQCHVVSRRRRLDPDVSMCVDILHRAVDLIFSDLYDWALALFTVCAVACSRPG